MKQVRLVFRALYEIVRYEVVLSLLGSGRILSQLKRQSISIQSNSAESEKTICDAVLLATCFYWKPVRDYDERSRILRISVASIGRLQADHQFPGVAEMGR